MLVLLVESRLVGSLPACPGWILGFGFKERCLFVVVFNAMFVTDVLGESKFS